MPVRSDKIHIPIIRDAATGFVLHCEAAGKKSPKDHRSLLLGATGRVVGRAAAGPALAQSELGGLRCDRVTVKGMDRWFLIRVPLCQADATRKKARSIQRQFVTHIVRHCEPIGREGDCERRP
jgi:hypothetical protein